MSLAFAINGALGQRQFNWPTRRKPFEIVAMSKATIKCASWGWAGLNGSCICGFAYLTISPHSTLIMHACACESISVCVCVFYFALTLSNILQFPVTHAPLKAKAFFGRTANIHSKDTHTHTHATHIHTHTLPSFGVSLFESYDKQRLHVISPPKRLRNLIVLTGICLCQRNLIKMRFVFN